MVVSLRLLSLWAIPVKLLLLFVPQNFNRGRNTGAHHKNLFRIKSETKEEKKMIGNYMFWNTRHLSVRTDKTEGGKETEREKEMNEQEGKKGGSCG